MQHAVSFSPLEEGLCPSFSNTLASFPQAPFNSTLSANFLLPLPSQTFPAPPENILCFGKVVLDFFVTSTLPLLAVSLSSSSLSSSPSPFSLFSRSSPKTSQNLKHRHTSPMSDVLPSSSSIAEAEPIPVLKKPKRLESINRLPIDDLIQSRLRRSVPGAPSPSTFLLGNLELPLCVTPSYDQKRGILEELLKKKAGVKSKRTCCPSLGAAIEKQHINCFAQIWIRIDSININTPKNGRLLLCKAVEKLDGSILTRLLLGLGADCTLSDSEHLSALSIAIRIDSIETFQTLLVSIPLDSKRLKGGKESLARYVESRMIKDIVQFNSFKILRFAVENEIFSKPSKDDPEPSADTPFSSLQRMLLSCFLEPKEHEKLQSYLVDELGVFLVNRPLASIPFFNLKEYLKNMPEKNPVDLFELFCELRLTQAVVHLYKKDSNFPEENLKTFALKIAEDVDHVSALQLVQAIPSTSSIFSRPLHELLFRTDDEAVEYIRKIRSVTPPDSANATRKLIAYLGDSYTYYDNGIRLQRDRPLIDGMIRKRHTLWGHIDEGKQQHPNTVPFLDFKFPDEIGGGVGVYRDTIQKMLQEMIDHKVFVPIDTSGSLFINDTENITPFFVTPEDDPDFEPPYETSEMMEIIGCTFALSLALEIPLGRSLHPLLLETLYSEDPDSFLCDLPAAARFITPPHADSLRRIQDLIDAKDFAAITAMDLDFSFFEFDTESNNFKMTPLPQNDGKDDKIVTKQNAQLFVNLAYDKLLSNSKSRTDNAISFARGFQRIFQPFNTPLAFLTRSAFHDFHLGAPRVTLADFKSVLTVSYEHEDLVTYANTQPECEVLQKAKIDENERIMRTWVFDCVERLEEEELSNFFFVITSRKVFPSHGLCEKIDIAFSSSISVPHVYTCYSSVSFPFYSSPDDLLSGIRLVISHHDSHGFFAN